MSVSPQVMLRLKPPPSLATDAVVRGLGGKHANSAGGFGGGISSNTTGLQDAATRARLQRRGVLGKRERPFNTWVHLQRPVEHPGSAAGAALNDCPRAEGEGGTPRSPEARTTSNSWLMAARSALSRLWNSTNALMPSTPRRCSMVVGTYPNLSMYARKRRTRPSMSLAPRRLGLETPSSSHSSKCCSRLAP